MRIETKIKMDKYKPRSYQLPLIDAWQKGYKRILGILPRRAGKDFCCFNIIIRAALERVGTYWYILPTFTQARRTIWESMTNEGFRFLDLIPPELVESMNSTTMSIVLVNGSRIQLLGSDNYDSLVGSNAIGCVFSEYALQDPRAYQFLRPMLTANDGFAIFISTPRGHNHLHDLYQIAQNNPQDWFCYKLTVDDTQHIPLQEIEREIASSELSSDMALQEYWTSFDMGVEGSYYSKYIDKMRVAGRIANVPWEPTFKVHTAWDLGVHDATCIIFFQVIGQNIHFIDCYTNNDKGLDHYAKVLQQGHRADYVYGKMAAPHDISVREFTSGVARIDKARQLGINFTIAPNLSIEDGIEATRAMLSKVWLDQVRCAPLLKALESYRREYDSKRKTYKDHPLHDWSSNFADAARMLAVSLPKFRDGLSSEDLDKRYREAMLGTNAQLPRMFRDDV